MKKVTVILSMLVFAISSQSFAQNATRPDAVKTKPTEPKPGETGYMQIKMTDVLVSSAQPKPATKPKPAAKIEAKKPGTKAAFMKLGDVKAESHNN